MYFKQSQFYVFCNSIKSRHSRIENLDPVNKVNALTILRNAHITLLDPTDYTPRHVRIHINNEIKPRNCF